MEFKPPKTEQEKVSETLDSLTRHLTSKERLISKAVATIVKLLKSPKPRASILGATHIFTIIEILGEVIGEEQLNEVLGAMTHINKELLNDE